MKCMHEYQRSFSGDPHPTRCTQCGETRGQTEWKRRFKELTGFEKEPLMNTITATGAHIMTQALCRSFVDQTPAWELPGDWVKRSLALQASIGRIIGHTPTVDDITELVTSFEEMESVETGTHPDLVRNEARTVDNSLELTERILARLNQETWTLLNNAGFTTVRNVACRV